MIATLAFGSPPGVYPKTKVDLGWPHRRCILCKREVSGHVPFSRAHLVPDSIGGFVWAWTKCKECNEEVGSSVEAAVVQDDSIIFSIDALRDDLPDLADVSMNAPGGSLTPSMAQ